MVLPNFFLCGAQKAGTTSLHAYLDQHPDVFMSRPKETFFFDRHYDRGLEWLASHFEEYDGEYAVGEATTRTMSTPGVPERVAEHFSDAKLLFILRNPIERAYSQYHYDVYTGSAEATHSFHEVIRNDESAFREEMIEQGKYASHLARFDEHFDRSQVKVLLFDDFRERTAATVQEVYRFLNVDPSYDPSTEKRRNVTKYSSGSRGVYYWLRRLWQPLRRFADTWFPSAADALRRTVRGVLFSEEKPQMRADDRAYLRRIFAEPNARLEERLGRDLSHWT